MSHNTAALHTAPADRRTAHHTHRSARTAPGRTLTFTELALLSLLALAAVMAVISVNAAPRIEVPRMDVIHVGAGDSLWTIAQAHPVEGLSTQQNVELIIDANDLQSTVLTIGTEIMVPSSAREPQTRALALK